jgi:hypothetical protein
MGRIYTMSPQIKTPIILTTLAALAALVAAPAAIAPAGPGDETLSGNARRPEAARRLAPFAWQEAGPGFEWARAGLLYGAGPGPNDLYLARFDPARHIFRPYQETDMPGSVDMEGWAGRLTAALALINAGQYYPDRRYMGRLRRDGRDLSPDDHPRWQGFLVSDPRPEAPPGLPPAAVIDRKNPEPGLDPSHYLNVMQSFMLLDRRGRPRVRDSANLAARAAVAEDRAGRILLLMTPAAVSLHDLALVLQDPRLELVKALGLDGGLEAQFFLRRGEENFLVTGPYALSSGRAVHLPGYRPTLPAVLAVEPRP